MSNFIQIEDCGSFGKILSQDDWQDIIKNRFKTSNFKILRNTIKPFSDVHVGFLGDHLSLKAAVALSGKKDPVCLEFFAKSIPRENKAFEEYVIGTQGFVKEYKFYSDILPDLLKHRNRDSSSVWFSECYLAKPDILVLENLINQGFRHFNCKPSIDYKHCVVAAEALARFHAESVIFEEKEGCSIGVKHADILFETIWVEKEGHPGNGLLVSSLKAMKNLLPYLPDYNENEEKYKIISQKFVEVLSKVCEYVKPSKKYRNVICHGDAWSSNIFYCYDESGEPIGVRLVDFQLFRYNPPAFELLCFIYCVSDVKFRGKYFDEILCAYFKAFSRELQKHKLDPNKLQFSREEFMDSCNYYRNGARITSVLYFQNMQMDATYLKKVFTDPVDMKMFMMVDKTKYLIENYVNDSYFREINDEVMQEMFQYCVLNKCD